ncbi:MAG TPA: helix-turn-helix domain-containing protein, partial [Longimicrobiaceae bacterium]|nr:helix-turn-helix domain-containing protein [Longimicrobiaceae bacterium]
NVLRIELPSLRERRADIPRLIERFIRHFSATYDRPFVGMDPEALRLLVEYEWPGNVRELRNMVESMVILAPGRVIRPEDIPPEVRHGGRRAGALVPVAPPRPSRAETNGDGAPRELEFIFRTLYDLKLDIDDLRREFEAYRHRQPDPLRIPVPEPGAMIPFGALGAPRTLAPVEPEPEEERGTVVFRPGMTMQDLEREAISAALREASGNRRRAAEMLDIGERTLYRKIKEYGIET